MTLMKTLKGKKTLAVIGSTLAALTLSATVAAHSGNWGDRGDDRHHRGHGGEAPEQMDEQRIEHRMERMKRFLDLSEEQVSQLKTLFEKYQSERAERPSPKALHQALRDLDPMDSEYQSKVKKLIEAETQQMAERMQTRATMRQEVYQLLNADQRARLEMMEEMRHSMRDKGPKGMKRPMERPAPEAS